MIQSQREILMFFQRKPDYTATKSEVVEAFRHQYYELPGVAERYIGNRLSALVRNGKLLRIKPGVYRINI